MSLRFSSSLGPSERQRLIDQTEDFEIDLYTDLRRERDPQRRAVIERMMALTRESRKALKGRDEERFERLKRAYLTVIVEQPWLCSLASVGSDS